MMVGGFLNAIIGFLKKIVKKYVEIKPFLYNNNYHFLLFVSLFILPLFRLSLIDETLKKL
jgi:hypothetical protein